MSVTPDDLFQVLFAQAEIQLRIVTALNYLVVAVAVSGGALAILGALREVRERREGPFGRKNDL